MRDLIARYEYGLKYRLYEIVTDLVASKRLTGASRPRFVYDVGKVRTLAPLMPRKMLNAAVNFYSHVGEGTLTLPVVAGEAPTPGTGAYLPPVSSYRK